MKKILQKLFIYLLVLYCPNPAIGAKNIALIIAVENYKSDDSWFRLKSVKRDTLLLKSALLLYGFEPNSIKVIYDPDYNQMIMGIKNFLIDRAGPGDKAYFHFSGHGQQIQDLNGDEADLFDEALIPIGASAKSTDTYNGESHVTDDTLRNLFNTLRRKLGKEGSLLVTIDACHSGTGIRTADQIETDESQSVPRGSKFAFYFRDNPNTFGVSNNYENFGLFKKGESIEYAPYFALYGSSQLELNEECKVEESGSLSFAFSKALRAADQKSTTYYDLFNEVRIILKKHCRVKNNAQYEGDHDLLLFSNRTLDKSIYFKSIGLISSEKAVIDGGQFAQISEKDTIEFYENNDTLPIFTGIVEKTNIECAEVKFNVSIDSTILGMKARKLSTVGIKPLKVYLIGESSFNWELKHRLARSNFVEIDNSSYLYKILFSLVKDTVKVEVFDKMQSRQFYKSYQREDTLILDELQYFLERRARGFFINNLEGHKNDNVDLYIYKVKARKNGTQKFQEDSTKMVSLHGSHSMSFNPRDTIIYNIKSEQQSPFYYIVFELDPDKSFDLVCPPGDSDGKIFWDENQGNKDFEKVPGDNAFHNVLILPEKTGEYQYKLLISSQQYDRKYIEKCFTEKGIKEQIKQSISHELKPKGAFDDFPECKIFVQELKLNVVRK